MHLSRSISDYLRAIRQSAQATPLKVPQETIRVLRARFTHKIGPRYYSLFELDKRAPQEWSRYIQDPESNPQLREVAGENLILARDKLLFTEHCLNAGLPTVPIICYIDNGARRALPDKRIASIAAWESALENAPNRIFVKLIAGAHGTDAFSATRSDGRWHFRAFSLTNRELYDYIRDNIVDRSGWLIQPAISTHDDLTDIMPNGALGTIRILTYRTSGGVETLLPVLRLPANGNSTDNFSEGRGGNIVAPINFADGTIGLGRTSLSPDWPQIVGITHHPETKAPIEGRRIPFWKETLDLVRLAQLVTPKLPTVGWDIAITNAGPLIIEANTAFGLNVLQVAYQRGVRAEFSKLLRLAATTDGP